MATIPYITHGSGSFTAAPGNVYTISASGDANAGVPVPLMTDQEAIGHYSQVSGYDPEKPETDTGLYQGNVGAHCKTKCFSIGDETEKIGGFVDCCIGSLNEVLHSVFLTGNSILALCRASRRKSSIFGSCQPTAMTQNSSVAFSTRSSAQTVRAVFDPWTAKNSRLACTTSTST